MYCGSCESFVTRSLPSLMLGMVYVVVMVASIEVTPRELQVCHGLGRQW